jgi:DNA repair exonuclease SbcCD nuclease subunit
LKGWWLNKKKYQRMKNYCLNTLGLTVLIFTFNFTTHADGQKVSHFISNPAELSTIIKIPEFKDSLKIMQVTDTHISIADEKESDLMKYGERMHKAYMNPRKHYSQDVFKTTLEYLDDLLLKAKNEKIELLLLTGDIVNFPSAVSVKYVCDRLMKTGIPWLFVSGNHDWHYEGMNGSLDSLRKMWIDKSLLPLYSGHNPLFYSAIINGINFVGIDNSTGQVNDTQVGFLKDQLKRKEPVILISHIPYNFNRQTDQPGMVPLIDIISSNSNKIIAILAGHIHKSTFYFTGSLCEYTSLAAFQGASFIVNIKSE